MSTPRPFYPRTLEGHRRPYARNAFRLAPNWMRRNRCQTTIPALIARYERMMREGQVAA